MAHLEGPHGEVKTERATEPRMHAFFRVNGGYLGVLRLRPAQSIQTKKKKRGSGGRGWILTFTGVLSVEYAREGPGRLGRLLQGPLGKSNQKLKLLVTL